MIPVIQTVFVETIRLGIRRSLGAGIFGVDLRVDHPVK